MLYNKMAAHAVRFLPCVVSLLVIVNPAARSVLSREIAEIEIATYREKVRQMFFHAYDNYLKHAYPYDELRPLSCDGVDTWGSFSLTLIDALDTLAVMGNYSEFRRVAQLLIDRADFDMNINVSVFETNIRVVGGLLSAHLLSHRAGMELEPSWPCSGPLLRLAEDLARRLLPAFKTATGMPYGTVNLRYGVPAGETAVTCTAGVATFVVEFGALSRLTGDPAFENAAVGALRSLWALRSPLGLVGNHVDVVSGRWTALDSGIGAGVDSYYEYLVKGAILLQRPELIAMFKEYRNAIDRYILHDDWYMWVNMQKGHVTMPVFQSLEAFWPGLLAYKLIVRASEGLSETQMALNSYGNLKGNRTNPAFRVRFHSNTSRTLVGDLDSALKSIHNYHQVWKQYGFTPEFYNIPEAEPSTNREGYPLRPELVESIMYLYRATKDPLFLQMGIDVVQSINYSARTPCGFATIKDVRTHAIEDRMESFFLAETTKYLYLLFDGDNFLHADGRRGRIVQTTHGECVLEAGGYIFNTEAHPIDAAAVYCCSAAKEEGAVLQNFHDNMDLLALLGLTQGVDGLKNVRPKRKSRRILETTTSSFVKNVQTSDISPKPDDHQDDQYKEVIEDTSRIVVQSDLVTEDYSSETSLPIAGVTVSGPDSLSAGRISVVDDFVDPIDVSGIAAYLGDVDLEAVDSPNNHDADDNRDDDDDDGQIKTDDQEVDEDKMALSSEIFWAGTKPILSNVLQRDTLQSTGQPRPTAISSSAVVVAANLNGSAVQNASKLRVSYDVMSCPAQPFILKLSLMGEMFGVN